jgi:hypothetical protein
MPSLLSAIGLHHAGATSVASSLLYDTKNQGSIFSLDLKYLPSTRWEIGVGADLLGSQDTSSNQTASNSSGPNDFIGRFQANDRLRAGVKYVF